MTRIILTHSKREGLEALQSLLYDVLGITSLSYTSPSLSHFPTRGNPLIDHVIIDELTKVPFVKRRSADIIIAGNPYSAYQCIDYLKPGGMIITDTDPGTYLRDISSPHTSVEEILTRLRIYSPNVHPIPATRLSEARSVDNCSATILIGHLIALNIIPVRLTQVHKELDEAESVNSAADALDIGYSYQSGISALLG